VLTYGFRSSEPPGRPVPYPFWGCPSMAL
jgi:hypothetical protein